MGKHPALEQTGYHLVAFTDGEVSSVDGPHSTPQGVATALRLYKGLGFFKAGAVYRMVLVAEIEAAGAPGPVNEEAMHTMGALVRHHQRREE